MTSKYPRKFEKLNFPYLWSWYVDEFLEIYRDSTQHAPFTFHPFLQVLGVRVVHPSKQSYLRLGVMEVAHDTGMRVAIKNRILWVFPKIGGPQNGWFIMENPMKFMIWGYHYFWKHPYLGFGFKRLCWMCTPICRNDSIWQFCLNWANYLFISHVFIHLFYCPRLHERPIRRNMEQAGFWHHSAFSIFLYIIFSHIYNIYIYLVFIYIYKNVYKCILSQDPVQGPLPLIPLDPLPASWFARSAHLKKNKYIYVYIYIYYMNNVF